ncbi:MAG: class F sortase [bacterium]|nr:class F sortase [bacterium]
MKAEISSKWFWVIVSGVFITLFLTIILFPDDAPSIRSVIYSNNLNYPKPIRSELPVRLKIPKINIDSALEYVGLAFDGTMDIPKGPDDAAWFNIGPRPGDIGSAVVSGHYGWKNEIPAVFDNLHKLQEGDKIYIEDEKGATITFVVRELRRYGAKEYASDVFNSNDGLPHLNLITCEGVWNKTEKSYSDRLVVFTDKEIE